MSKIAASRQYVWQRIKLERSAVSCDVYIKVKIRAVNVRRFVREFKQAYGAQVESTRGLKTEGEFN